ncbi:DNA-binding response regulator, partial [Pelomonas sp. HMWF004]
MTALRVLIVDDEPLARLRLRGLVDAIQAPRCEVVAEAATGAQALAWLRDQPCDIVLLDVQMPGVDGLQMADALAQRLQPGTGPLVIFVTAHAMHALRAFELEALDYLTKPVRRERLQAALARAAQRLSERAAVLGPQTAAEAPASREYADFINITDRGRLLRVPLAEV